MDRPLRKEIPFIPYHFSRLFLAIFNRLPNHRAYDRLRRFLLRCSGINVRQNVKVFSPLFVSPKTIMSNITFERGVFVNSFSRFSAPADAKIIIGENSLVAPNVSFETVNHNTTYIKNTPRGATVKSIVLEDGVWIGSGTIVLQGVTIESGSVVAAGSVVTKSFGPNIIIGGVPAKVLRENTSMS